MLNCNLKWLIFAHQVLLLSANNYFKHANWMIFDDRTIIKPDTAYECETWSSMLTDEHRLKVFENGVMRKML